MNMFTSADNDGKSVFVFGSNTAGRHGAGAAREAVEHWGAEYGNGYGRQGQSYAIPTKDQRISTLDLGAIEREVFIFINYAKQHPELRFLVTKIGCGLAGLAEKDIAPMFRNAPVNCVLPEGWREIILQRETDL
jgi:hypothetical protein